MLLVDLLLITGLSGAGKTEAAKVLEDVGWFVVDNLPPSLMSKVVELASLRESGVARVAVVADVRGGVFFEELESGLSELESRSIGVRILFLDASDEALIRRFEGNRRRHPLREVLSEGIAHERLLLERMRARADVVIDTSEVNVHQLRAQLVDLFSPNQAALALQVSLVSFGFKNGLPLDADMVFDVRFLPNPHWVDELRPLPGTDPQVRTYVKSQPATAEFLRRAGELVCYLMPHYVEEGKAYLTIAVGCTGGRHRSVVIAEALGSMVQGEGFPVIVRHRDLDK